MFTAEGMAFGIFGPTTVSVDFTIREERFTELLVPTIPPLQLNLMNYLVPLRFNYTECPHFSNPTVFPLGLNPPETFDLGCVLTDGVNPPVALDTPCFIPSLTLTPG